MNKKPMNVTNRELHLIDIENETGKPNPTAVEIAKFRAFYCERNNVPRDAHVVIAASSGASLLEASVGWPGARTTFLPGRDGADLALIEVALGENVDQRYGKVVIA